MTGALGSLFTPRALAILGVSRHPAKLGHRLLQNVKESGYPGAVYPVHPSGEPILGYATVRAIEALPEGIDLALVSACSPGPAGSRPARTRRWSARSSASVS
ncbi:MAG: hypothetical protein AUH81_14200 [Candidatus Rokubacteria bacterium 13_1_40CM_4_69_5]|nr:MAG: hypothetical protein AUH81_14200 [Candidatus Rokubacteria bacterium 13_1_40CM_4_69_5]